MLRRAARPPGRGHGWAPGRTETTISGDSDEGSALPSGELYDWFVRGTALLDGGNPEAAAELLSRVRAAEPGSASVLEALSRALFDARRFSAAARSFEELVAARPDSDYARFGLGLTLARLGQFEPAAEQLALAVAMAPHRREYGDALRQARATLRAREQATGAQPTDGARPTDGSAQPDHAR